MPVLALLAPRGTSARVAPLLALVGAAGVEVVSWSACLQAGVEPSALLVADEAALDEAPPEVPRAVWVADADGHRRVRAAGATLSLSPQAEAVAAGAVLVPRAGIDLSRWPPIAPLVRQRWRERFGLPRELVVAVEPGHDADDLPTDLAMASVAVIAGPDTALALALATPVVTSVETAGRMGLRAGVDVEVADSPDAATDLARRIASSEHRAAALSRRGRRFAERRLDLGPAVQAVIVSLDLGAGPQRCAASAAGASAAESWVPFLVRDRLAELNTPMASPLRTRVVTAFAPFSPASPGATT